MTSPTASAPRRVLLLLAGIKRNAPELGDARSGLRIARMRELAPLAQVFILATTGDAVARSHADALARDLQKLRLAPRVLVREFDTGSPPAPRTRAGCRDGAVRVVEALARREFGARFADHEFVVSSATGTPAQWTSLVDALDARGARLAVAHEREDDRLSVWRCPPDVRGVEPDIALLERAPAAWNVLLSGPTGAGKTDTARRLHEAWARGLGRTGRFESVNAAAIARELLQSELFGHMKGSFTGATSDRDGAFRKAHGGTLFLDEIGDLPLDLQVRLLTVLEVDGQSLRRTVRPVGSDKVEQVDVRVIFGTNRDLHAMANDSRFRLDLLGRISTHHVRLPGLASARHRIAGAYLHHLEALAPLYASVDGGPVRFTLEETARLRLLAFAFSPESSWPWNHRDVRQSAERLAMRAWANATPRRSGSGSERVVTLSAAHVAAEVAELEARWRALDAGAGASQEGGWAAVEATVRPEEWPKMSMIERWELRYLLEAREGAPSNAEAWRRIAAKNQLEGAADPASLRNPSNAFDKRWRRYAKRLRPSPPDR